MADNQKDTEPDKRDLGIYIHIPFCISKCSYCDFLSAPATDEMKEAYMKAVLIEIESYSRMSKDYLVRTIFIGGGTPSCIDAKYIYEIMDKIHEIFLVDEANLEATIEVNPGTITKEKLMTYREAGINRLSFGLQSVSDTELKLLGRIHTYSQFKENYLLAREVGFCNINIDLMSALPGQTVESWENTLNTVLALAPEHISAYGLIIEEGTRFFKLYGEQSDKREELPDEETDRLMYRRTKEILATNGYERYEISNYAKHNYDCKHNMFYWTGVEYLGFGIGAASLLEGARHSNMHNIEQYIQRCNHYRNSVAWTKRNAAIAPVQESGILDPIGITDEVTILNENQKMEEFMFLGLRRMAGVSKKAFLQRFHKDMDSVYDEVIQRLQKNNTLLVEGDCIRLTDFGIDVSNVVLSEFLLD